jgi:outer membrane protein TolC
MAPAAGPPVTLDLAGALQRARDYNQQFLAAGITTALAREDRVQAKAALYPTLNWFNQYLYTQGNGTPSGIFIGNNGVHEYGEQAVVHTELSAAKRWDYQRTIAAEAVARARQDIALRGLTATVVQSYYALAVAQRHEANAVRSVDEAARFLDITEKQQRGGEAAMADVIKSRLQFQQRQRELIDAQANTQKARITLGVIVFPNLQQAFDIADDLASDGSLPPMDEIRALALSTSPDIRASEAALRQARAGIGSAKAAAYIPTLTLDYFYGIDANVFGIRGPEGQRNLGSVVQAGVNFQLWNWGANRSKVRQAELQQRQAQLELSFAQRNLQAGLTTFYVEAQAARAQLESLRSSLDLSVESLRLTLLRYQAGEATALEVVDAQSTLTQARNAYDDGLARLRIALAALQTLTGRL